MRVQRQRSRRIKVLDSGLPRDQFLHLAVRDMGGSLNLRHGTCLPTAILQQRLTVLLFDLLHLPPSLHKF